MDRNRYSKRNIEEDKEERRMNEREWVKSICQKIVHALREFYENLRVGESLKLPYSSEVLEYDEKGKPIQEHLIKYETDILVYELTTVTNWTPRVVIEAKISRISTHDSITYSNKAQTHKNVHPYLRYGILIGNMKNDPLPGRLFRHGQQFDFMLSWKSFDATNEEWNNLIDILRLEVKASQSLEEIIFNSRSSNRERYTVLHKPLILI